MSRCLAGATVLAAALALGAAAGCSNGKPGFRSETLRPDQEHDFAILYRENCSACHGDRGMNGAALPLNNPVYLAWAGHDRIRQIVSEGVPNTLMPPFGHGAGGLLTDQQIDAIVNGMMAHWSRPDILNAANAPGYTARSKGDPALGQASFQTYCAGCHGADGKGASPGGNQSSRSGLASKAESAVGSIIDPTYLSLISDQALRDIIVSGMPGQDMPDWRGDVQGKAMTDKDVTDVVAWLVSHRVQYPGRPFPEAQRGGATEKRRRAGGNLEQRFEGSAEIRKPDEGAE